MYVRSYKIIFCIFCSCATKVFFKFKWMGKTNIRHSTLYFKAYSTLGMTTAEKVYLLDLVMVELSSFAECTLNYY